MARFKFNIFYVISIVCILLLIGYIWIIFLPIFEGSLEYDAIRSIAILITILLAISTVLTLFQMMEK